MFKRRLNSSLVPGQVQRLAVMDTDGFEKAVQLA